MPMAITTYERRDGADLNALGHAALALCRATRTVEGVRTRFYWEGPDRIVLITEAASPEAFAQADPITGELNADTAKAVFTLADLARLVETRRLQDPAAGVEAYRAAGFSLAVPHEMPRTKASTTTPALRVP